MTLRQTPEAERLAAENAALRRVFDVRRWDQRLHDAWHQAIPDVQKAFENLLSAAQVAQAGMVRCPRCWEPVSVPAQQAEPLTDEQP